MAYKVYVSGSNQNHNLGVGNYGTEASRMHELSDEVKRLLDAQDGKFEVFRNTPDMELAETVKDCNSKGCKLFVENHTNAASSNASGTEVYYYGAGGTGCNSYRFACLLYNNIAPLSPGSDRGVKPDTSLYKGGLYVIQNTAPPAALIEHIFHTNAEEVDDFINNMDEYAKAEAKAICQYFGEEFIEPTPVEAPTPVYDNIEIGSVVTIKIGAVYGGLASARGVAVPGSKIGVPYKVLQIQTNKEVLEARLEGINSWVAIASLELVTAAPTPTPEPEPAPEPVVDYKALYEQAQAELSEAGQKLAGAESAAAEWENKYNHLVAGLKALL